MVCEDSLLNQLPARLYVKAAVEFLAAIILTGGEPTPLFREQLQIGENVPDYPTLES